ncbi:MULTISPECIES: hypothetical protein [unclassified Rhodococcus (in: high G+C Gram-positive bacteria)]|uniref:hypothetical protein n=1 Tax=unclassified Rhodococcus (in: high G+C Gram-positive bacteria) TaxID=192944 RepID=UPI002078C997|nr:MULTISPECIES: hypothetical protein [unclassified Rhodococcus (in: high G+C Gram-positive bacteria)]
MDDPHSALEQTERGGAVIEDDDPRLCSLQQIFSVLITGQRRHQRLVDQPLLVLGGRVRSHGSAGPTKPSKHELPLSVPTR